MADTVEVTQETPRKLTPKQRAFIAEYLKDFNGTQAAIRAGYSERTARQIANKLLTLVDISEAIDAEIAERSMSADEVLKRLAEHARADMGDFLDIGSMAFQVDLEKAKEKGITHLIKKVKMRTTTTLSKEGVETETHDIELELHDPQAALVQLGRHHKLFTDKTELTGKDGDPMTIVSVGFDIAQVGK
jgi:phage terminase small subunit